MKCCMFILVSTSATALGPATMDFNGRLEEDIEMHGKMQLWQLRRLRILCLRQLRPEEPLAHSHSRWPCFVGILGTNIYLEISSLERQLRFFAGVACALSMVLIILMLLSGGSGALEIPGNPAVQGWVWLFDPSWESYRLSSMPSELEIDG